MRKEITVTMAALTLGILSSLSAPATAQCQRQAGGNAQRQSVPQSSFGDFTQSVSASPSFQQMAFQQMAFQQAARQSLAAQQQLRLQQVALREQARRTMLAQRHATARQRRENELARREELRTRNFARRDGNSPPQGVILVARN